MVKLAGSRTFVLKDGRWYDTAFDPAQMKPASIPFLSPEYFALAESRADVAAALALGQKVVIVVGGAAYEIVESGQQAGQSVQPATITPTATAEGLSQPGQVVITPTPTPTDGEPSPDSPILCTAIALPLLLFIFLASASRRKE